MLLMIPRLSFISLLAASQYALYMPAEHSDCLEDGSRFEPTYA